MTDESRTDNTETLKNALARIKELEEENAQLKKDYEETEELLTEQIEATLKLDKENAELREKIVYWQSEYEKLFNEE